MCEPCLQLLTHVVPGFMQRLPIQSCSFIFFFQVAILGLEWNPPCMAMSFLVCMSVSFRSAWIHLTTAAENRITAKVFIAVTLFLLESLFL